MLSLLFFPCFFCLFCNSSRADPISTPERWLVLSNRATQCLPLSLMGHRVSGTPLLKMTAPTCKCNGHNAKEIFSQEGMPPPNSLGAFLIRVVIQKTPILQALIPNWDLCGLYFHANGCHHPVDGTACDSGIPDQPLNTEQKKGVLVPSSKLN